MGSGSEVEGGILEEDGDTADLRYGVTITIIDVVIIIIIIIINNILICIINIVMTIDSIAKLQICPTFQVQPKMKQSGMALCFGFCSVG